MSDAVTPERTLEGLSVQERDAVDRLLIRIARHADAFEQAIEVVERLAGSGSLAVANAFLEDFDQNFSAMTRPEFMGMVSNLMMLLGLLSQISYEPFFTAAMNTAKAVNAAYPRARARQRGMSVREMMAVLRSPEMAGALELLMAVLRAQRDEA